MESSEIILACVISVVFGFAASWLFGLNQRSRGKKINEKIRELEYKEKLIDSIGNGYKSLIQHGFRAISFSLFLVFSSVTAILAIKVFPYPLPKAAEIFVWSMSVPAWGAAAAICLSVFNDISSLKDIDAAKMRLRDKRAKLEKKL